jgi:lysophospholipase
MSKDSTNMVPADWTRMAKAVHKRLNKGYHGFVIAHGTDTMHFSASALAFAFGPNLNVPIVFTGAQAIPAVPHGDARVNLLRAVQVASQNFSEVVVAFGDYILRGCRVQKKDEKRFDAFESPAEFPLGYITEEIILSSTVRRHTPDTKPIEFNPYFVDEIVQISLTPGLQPEVLEPILKNPRCKGIVLQSYGAGNVPNLGRYSFKRFIKTATKMGKPVVIASQFPANATLASNYEPGVQAIKAGAIPTGNMTNAAATVKFQWIMHKIENDPGYKALPSKAKLKLVLELMNKDYVGEITEIRSKPPQQRPLRRKKSTAKSKEEHN